MGNAFSRRQEGELLSLAVYSSCPMRGERVSYAVTSGSGAVVSWGEERVVEAPAASSEAARLVQLNLRCVMCESRER